MRGKLFAGIGFLGGIVFLYLLFFSGFFSEREIRNYPSSGKDIIAFGDSLVEGAGSSVNGGFVTFLSEDVQQKIVNLGRSGDTTADALKRVDEIFAYEPKIVIILLGGNDFLRRIPKDIVFKNLQEIIERIQERGAVVLLLGVKGGVFGDSAESYFEDIVERTGSAYVPDVLRGIFGHADYMYDSIHPNEKGYRIIADRLAPVLRSLLE